MAIALRQTRLIPSAMSFAAYFSVDQSATGLLLNENQGFSFNATTNPPTVSVKDTGTPANNLNNVTLDASTLTQAGTSPKIVHWPTGNPVRWTPHNMFLNSGAPVTQNVTLVTGFNYTFGITGAGTLTGSSGASGAATAGSPVTFTATGTTGTFTVSGGTPTTMQINRGAVLTDYLTTSGAIRIGIPQGYDVTNSKFGILIEPAATNIQTESNDFTSWTLDGAASASAGFTAPDGSTDAALIVENTANSAHGIYNIRTVSNATAYTASVYAKAESRDWIVVNLFSSSDLRVWFNLTTGTVGTVTAGATASIISIGDGWHRCIVSGVTDDVTGAVGLQTASADNVSIYLGNGVSGVYVWGPQLELGTVATSHVPTPVAATATRAIDQIKALIVTLPYSTTVGTVYADALCRDLSGLGITWWFNDAGDTNVIKVNYDNSAGVIYFIEAAGVAQLGASGLDIGNAVNNTRSQSTATWQANSFAGSVDGAAIATDISGSVGVGQTHLAIGADTVAGVRALNGFLYRFVYVPRRVTDGNLPTFRYNYP